MEHLVGQYIRNVLETEGWIYKEQHGFREGFSCESQIISLCQDLAEVVDKGGRIDAVIIDFSKAFDVVPHDILLRKLTGLGIDKRVVRWIQNFLDGRTQRVKIGNEMSDFGGVTSGVPQGSVIGPLLFLIFINDLTSNIRSKVRLFADDCIIYREICDEQDINAMQTDLDEIAKWVTQNRMKVNERKSCSIAFCKTREVIGLNYKLREVLIPQEQYCKYLGIYLNSSLGWAEQISNVTAKAWRSLHFIARILKKGSSKTKELAYLSLIRPLTEYGAVCWDPYRQNQIDALEHVQCRAAKFVRMGGGHGDDRVNALGWEPLESRRRKARLRALFKNRRKM
jgi:hypothetical protein